MNDEKNNNDDNKNNTYHLPDYSRLLSFPNFKSKLSKKLTVRRDILIAKKSIEENRNKDKKVKEYILSFLNEEIKTIARGNYIEDYKTLLQEISQKKMKCLPEYYLLKEKGPNHKKKFCIEVRLKETAYGIGLGDNKKEAEQQAAQNALKKLKIMN